MKLHQLSGHVYYSDPEERTDRPVLGYVKGDRYSLMVDAGNSSSHASAFLHRLNEAGLPPPDFVVLTHSHWDHAFGLNALNAVSFACSEVAGNLKKFISSGWNLEYFDSLIEEEIIPLFCRKHILLEYPEIEEIRVKSPDILFREELKISLGGVTCILEKLTTPHSNDCTAVYIPEERIVFLGDADCEKIVGLDFIEDHRKLAILTRKLNQMEFDTAVTGHTQPQSREELFGWFRERMQK